MVTEPTAASTSPVATTAPSATATVDAIAVANEEAAAAIESFLSRGLRLRLDLLNLILPPSSDANMNATVEAMAESGWEGASRACGELVPVGSLAGGVVYEFRGTLWNLDIWPPPHKAMAEAFIRMCLPINVYNAGQSDWESVSYFLTENITEFRRLMSELPDFSQAELRRAIAARQ